MKSEAELIADIDKLAKDIKVGSDILSQWERS